MKRCFVPLPLARVQDGSVSLGLKHNIEHAVYFHSVTSFGTNHEPTDRFNRLASQSARNDPVSSRDPHLVKAMGRGALAVVTASTDGAPNEFSPGSAAPIVDRARTAGWFEAAFPASC